MKVFSGWFLALLTAFSLVGSVTNKQLFIYKSLVFLKLVEKRSVSEEIGHVLDWIYKRSTS